MIKKILSTIVILAIITSAVPFQALPELFAQTSIEDQRAALEAELRQLQAEIAQKEAVLKAQQKQTGTIKKDVTLLTSQIDSARLKIRQKILAINNLSQEIKAKSNAIKDLEHEIGREHESLEQLLKRTNELDQKGATYVLLSADSVTDFYQDLDDFLAVKQQLYSSVNKIKQIKNLTEEQKEDLESKQAEEEDAKDAIDAQKRLVEKSEAEKKKLLAASQSKEKEYQTILKERQKKVAEIQSKLFSLAGGTAAIPFKDAYAYAKEASLKTGVRPAFVLAILTQESNLGKNVGTCNRASDPISKKWQNIMPGPTHKASGRSSRDDQSAFLRITKALGLNPDTTPLSCPLPSGGWGGAMGPSQFIPTTWESVQSRVAASLGQASANPWRARDAVMASATYLKDRGGIGGEANERNAACRYYSGRACDGRAPANSFYGNSVMSLARGIQADIDYLEQYGVSRR